MLTQNDLDRMFPADQRQLAAAPLAVPTVHINGDSRDTLRTGYMAALHALQAASEALQAINPNDRNFYVQGPDAGPIARAQNRRRMASLAVIEDEITDLVLALDA